MKKMKEIKLFEVRAENCLSNKNALIIGGGIAGLLSARVLAKYFDKVVVLERDRYPHNIEPRQGVPQSYQVHVLLAKGMQILEELFPGLKTELIASGAININWTKDWRFLSEKGWAVQFFSDISFPACTRNLLEKVIREKLSNFNNISFLEESQVINLLSDDSCKKITGVEIKTSNNLKRHLFANLIIDASGRSSKATDWLSSLGYPIPEETKINSFLGYSCRIYQPPHNFQKDWKGITLMPKSSDFPLGGVIYPIEGNKWIVTLGGIAKNYPPTDEEGFLEFAQKLRSPIIYEAIKTAKALSPIYPYRGAINRFLHYEKMLEMPENFIVLGDAVCIFNPVYGQGMTTAALGVTTLDECLKNYNYEPTKNLLGFSKYFQQKLAKIVENSWLMATGEDLKWPSTEGGTKNLKIQFAHWYLKQINELNCEEPAIYLTFSKVMHLLEPSTTLFRPTILAKVLRQSLKSFFHLNMKKSTKIHFSDVKSARS